MEGVQSTLKSSSPTTSLTKKVDALKRDNVEILPPFRNSEIKAVSGSTDYNTPVVIRSSLLSRQSQSFAGSTSPVVETSQFQTKEGENFTSATLQSASSVSCEMDRSQDFLEPRAQTRFESFLRDSAIFRNDEKMAIRKWYESRFEKDAVRSFLLIKGKSGSGKTALAKSLQDVVKSQGGYFVTGKLDHLQRPEPYSALVSAFTEFTSHVIQRGPEEVARMRAAITERIGDESRILTNMIPALSQILGKTSENTESGARGEGTLHRFVFLFRAFLRSICSLEKPLILLLDDIHWVDVCSIDVLKHVIADESNAGLFIVGTCDSDLIAKNCHLSSQLQHYQEPRVSTVQVGNITEKNVIELVGGALNILEGGKTAESIGSKIYRKTGGNLFCISMCLRWLQRWNTLFFDKESQIWCWDEDELDSTLKVQNKHEFCLEELRRLPSQLVEALKVASCLGYNFDMELIEYVLDMPVKTLMEEALRIGFIIFDESRHNFAFVHDIIHKAVYDLILEKDKELFHVEIGRRLWRRLDKESLDQHIYIVLSQIQIGEKLVTREKERHGLANLCLHAGTKAALSSTFRTASVYLNLGVDFLDERSWRTEYDLALRLHNAAAEMRMCTGDMEDMEMLIEEVLLHGKRTEDTIQALSTRIYAMGMAGKQAEAVSAGVQVLKDLGETFPSRLCSARLISEMNSVRSLLRGKSNCHLLNLPAIENEEKLACMKILNLIFPSALFGVPKLAPFVALKLMKLTLKYGSSEYASLTYTVYGMFLIAAAHDVEEAFRFGKLGLELLNRYKAMEYLPRVYAAFYGVISPWKRPLRESLHPLKKAHHIGLTTGDFEFSSLCASIHCEASLEGGVPLGEVMENWENFKRTAISTGQVANLERAMPTVQAVKLFQGLSSDRTFKNVDISQVEAIRKEKGDSMALSNVCNQMHTLFLFNEYQKANDLSSFIIKNIWATPPSIEKAVLIFHVGMIALEMASINHQKRKNFKRARNAIKSFRNFSRMCPNNFADKMLLLEAEFARVRGRKAEAFEKYTCAIAMAKHSGFLFYHAMANERMARFLIANGDLQDAETYYVQSCFTYEQWGGTAKVLHLRNNLGSVFK